MRRRHGERATHARTGRPRGDDRILSWQATLSRSCAKYAISELRQIRGGDPMDMVPADMSKPCGETHVHRKAMKARDGAARAKRTLRLDWSNDTAGRDDNCAERAAIFSCTSRRAPDRDCGKRRGHHRTTRPCPHPCSCPSEFSRRSRRPFDEYGPVRKLARSAGALDA